MSQGKFKQCEVKVENVKDLESLFKLWREAHADEVEEIDVKINKARVNEECDGCVFEHKLYQGKIKDYENTISSHFVQFFYKGNCIKCNKGKQINKMEAWKYALSNAFNMDGCYGEFEPPKNGFKYICLLKEANDSEKVCVENYEPNLSEGKINEWILKERDKENMLIKLNKAFKIFINEKHSDIVCQDFTQYMAYMNVNKRGGTSTASGKDEAAVINYAKRYKDFILREIEILSSNREGVSVFVCGSKSYFTRLMGALFGEKVKIQCKNAIAQPDCYHNLSFIQIPHPSYWKVDFEELAKEMQKR